MSTFADFELFAKVVATGSLSGAGRELGLSPAVVSKRLRRLEDRLGTRLVQRTTRRVALTESGQGFYERVLAILSSVEEAETFVSDRQVAAQGTLKVTAPRAFGRMHLAGQMAGFMERHPGLSVNLVLDDEMVDIVGEGYDLAVRIAELPDSSLVARRLWGVRRVLVASPSYLARHGRPAAPDDLTGHRCVTAEGREPWALCGPDGGATHQPGGPLRTNAADAVVAAVEGGAGIGLCATWEVGDAIGAGRLARVLPAWEGAGRTAIHALYPSRRHLPAKVRALIDFLADLHDPAPSWDCPARPSVRDLPAELVADARLDAAPALATG